MGLGKIGAEQCARGRWASLTKGKKRIIEWQDLDTSRIQDSWDDLLAAVKEKDPCLFLKYEPCGLTLHHF